MRLRLQDTQECSEIIPLRDYEKAGTEDCIAEKPNTKSERDIEYTGIRHHKLTIERLSCIINAHQLTNLHTAGSILPI
jgi:hypothetical protein